MTITIRFDRRKFIKDKDNKTKGSVELDIYIKSGDRKFISTEVHVEKKYWDENKQKVVKHIHAENYNLKIQNLIDEVLAWERDVLLRKVTPTGRDLVAYLKGGTRVVNLNEYFWNQLKVDEARLAKGTYSARKAVLNKFDEFGVFSTDNFGTGEVEQYHNFLLDSMQAQSTRNHHKIIDLYLKRALNEGLIKRNPYRFFRKPKTRNRPIFLTAQELKKIRKYKGIERIEKARDLFLFQCLTGMAYSDMQSLRPGDIREGKFVFKERQKTGEVQMIPLLPEALEIINRYSGFGFCFPKISNQKLNAYLKELAAIRDIDKPLTTHVGRHTFATLMLEKGLPLETISHILGHASTKTTSVYSKMLVSKIQNDLNRLNIKSL